MGGSTEYRCKSDLLISNSTQEQAGASLTKLVTGRGFFILTPQPSKLLRAPAPGALSSGQAHEALGESLTFHSEMGHGSRRQLGSEFQAAKLGKEF